MNTPQDDMAEDSTRHVNKIDPTAPAGGENSWTNKGAVEGNSARPNTKSDPHNGSLTGQLGHRDHDEMLKDNDTDFPEPDAQAEHSGGQ